MYLLGHMATGYSLALLSARCGKQSLVLWAVFLVSILPDFDEFFVLVGVEHGTFTHTFVFLVPIAVILVYWKKQVFPYVVALCSHVVADMLIEREMIFFPLSRVTYGLDFGMSSGQDAVLEVVFFVVMVMLMWWSGDLRRLVGGGSENIGIVAPLVFLAGSMLIAASRLFRLGRITSLGYALPLEVITLGHIALLLLFVYSVTRPQTRLVK